MTSGGYTMEEAWDIQEQHPIDFINPRFELRVLLPATKIPPNATVTKRTGEQEYTLKHELIVYGIPKEGEKPLVVAGYFLIGCRGSINQIKPETQLHWNIKAEEFALYLQEQWEPEEQ